MYEDRKRKPPVMYQHPILEEVLIIENRGPNTECQKSEKEVIVDLSCGMSVLRGADVFVQGIMGAPPNMLAGDHVSVYADLDGKCLKGSNKVYTGNKTYVGNGVAQRSRAEIFKTENPLSGVGVLMTEPLYEAPSLSDLSPHITYPQNFPSAVCVTVLDPQPGEVILDMCAAPGGKTTHIATNMKDKGRVVAIDKTEQKIRRVKRNAQNWNLTCIECYAFDSTKSCDVNSDFNNGPPYPPETFDRILLDAPCSALGQRPSLKNPMSLKTLKSHPVCQRKLLEKAVDLLKPGGVLVYSTCTITLEENEEQVAWAINKFPCLSLDEQIPFLGEVGRQCEGLSEDEISQLQYFNPVLSTTDVLPDCT
ncbi:hypothetical protein FSP39_025417 [Pinctada imbricata]|uniref:SAM-dependent MTase RsmB/NOP-type domain-containing protein n=1 Tax=Pinctada imbricata TaxID=66713 RepID=A0AA88YXW1_PINIB|nr:hypothetical protein FSP39_025417 [Pinctada imbricata]